MQLFSFHWCQWAELSHGELSHSVQQDLQRMHQFVINP